MTGIGSAAFRLGDWLVEPDRGRVSRGGEQATLRPREMDLLVYLAERAGEVVRTNEIMESVWAGVEVTNDSLYTSVSQLRKVFDAGSGNGSVIETIPKRGYRLTATIEPVAQGTRAQASVSEGVDRDAASPDPVVVPARPLARHGLIIALTVVVGALALFWISSTEDEPEPLVESARERPDGGSIAVMPFIDLTPETDYTYFSDGITEEILNRLTRVPGLRVAARTSSFTFKDSGADVVEIGRALGVANLLEGSVRKEGDRVRIAVQLIDAVTGFQLWSESYERQLTSVFEIQNEISRNVANALQITLAGPEDADNADRPASAAVLDDYLLGLEAYRTQSFESLDAAVGHFEAALNKDPGFNSARVQLAATYLQLINTGARNDRGLIGEARELLQMAIDANSDDPSAHRFMGLAMLWLGDVDAARRELDRALDLSPSDSEAMTILANIDGMTGGIVDAREQLRRAVRIDPFSSNVLHSHALYEQMFGAVDSAEDAIARSVELYPTNPNAAWMLGRLRASEKGELASGLEEFLLAAELDAADHEIAAYIAATYWTLDLAKAAVPWMQRAERDGPNATTTLALEALDAALNGRYDAAVEISVAALKEGSERIHAHSLITRVLLYLAVCDVEDAEEAEAALARLDGLMPGKKMSPETLPETENLDAFLAFSDLSRRMLVTLASLYKMAGMRDDYAEMMRRLSLTRIGSLDDFRDRLRNDDYLLEAEIRALEGNVDGAFEMLDLAVDNGSLYLWQVSYEINPALVDLRGGPRWDDLISRIRERLGEERRLLASVSRVVVHGA